MEDGAVHTKETWKVMGGKKTNWPISLCFSCTEAEMGNALQSFTELRAEGKEKVGLALALILGSARRH